MPAIVMILGSERGKIPIPYDFSRIFCCSKHVLQDEIQWLCSSFIVNNEFISVYFDLKHLMIFNVWKRTCLVFCPTKYQDPFFGAFLSHGATRCYQGGGRRYGGLAWFSLWKPMVEKLQISGNLWENLWENLWKPLGGDISKLDLSRHLDTIVLIQLWHVITCYNGWLFLAVELYVMSTEKCP